MRLAVFTVLFLQVFLIFASDKRDQFTAGKAMKICIIMIFPLLCYLIMT